MTISAAKAEAAAELISGQNIKIYAHDDDPGGSHDANLSPGINPVVVETTDWGAFADDTTTTAQGGRVTKNTAELEFADEAAADGSIAYVTYWEASGGDGDGDGDGSPGDGEYDTWLMTIALDEAVPYSTGNRVYVPVSSLEAFGAGSS